jgi:hypothetical protein
MSCPNKIRYLIDWYERSKEKMNEFKGSMTKKKKVRLLNNLGDSICVYENSKQRQDSYK